MSKESPDHVKCFACKDIYPKTYIQYIDKGNVHPQQSFRSSIHQARHKDPIFNHKIPFCYNCMPDPAITKSSRSRFEVPRISEDILHKSFDDRGTEDFKHQSSPNPKKSSISHRKHRNSTITKIPKGVNHSLLNCKKAIMKSFRKLEVLKPLEPIFKNKKDGPEQPSDYTIDQSDIIRLMAKQLKNRRLSRDNSKNYIRLNKSQNIDASRILDKSRNTEAENTIKKSFSKAKFKVRKVRRKTNIRSNNKSHNKQVLKMVKTMNKAISSSSEDSLEREESEEESKKLTKAPKLPLSNLHSSTMNYLTIPGLDNDFSSNQTNLVNSSSKDLKDRKLIPKKSPIKSPSIKRRKINNLSILVPQREGNLLNSKLKSPRTAEKCLHKFTYPCIPEVNQSSKDDRSLHSSQEKKAYVNNFGQCVNEELPLSSWNRESTGKSCDSASILNKIFYSMLRVDNLISIYPTDSEKHKQMAEVKSYLQQYSDVFKNTQNELLQLEAREHEDLDQLSQFFNRIRKELDSKEQLLKAKYKNMLSSFQTSLEMDLEFLEAKCKSLCEVVDSYSHKFRTPTKLDQDRSDDIMNSYNLESILLKEKVGIKKLCHKEFTVQQQNGFKFPKIESNFLRVKDLVDEVDVMSPSFHDVTEFSRETVISLQKLEDSSKVLNTDCGTNYSARKGEDYLEIDESLEISGEIESQPMNIPQGDNRKKLANSKKS
ncbi:unnamed protein product [Moneuplotes crassus]|uniref:Uncharacterized protein n=1 Tax=Euplotes crassus TaxID=5936 RepID=A0AAD1UJQ8_EUPCR|nr:unnamed protein product [Moneuplotes crassus]